MDWSLGDCSLRMSSSTHGIPLRRPLVSVHRELRIYRFRRDGRQQSLQLIRLPILPSGASCLATMPSAREAVLCDVIMDHHWLLPDEAHHHLVEELSHYIRDIAAAAAARVGVAPSVTEARVTVLMGEETGGNEEVVVEEEVAEDVDDDDDDDDTDWEDVQVDHDDEVPSPSTVAPTKTATVDGQVAPDEEEEEAEGESCAICLEKMAAGCVWERRWLPFSHSFHWACLEGWLRRKTQCPLCRMELVPPGFCNHS